MKKRILSLFMIVLFAVNSIPFSILTAIAEDVDIIRIYLDNDFTEKIKVINKQYDGTVLAEVDFSDVVINNKNPEDQVYLTASAEFANKDSSDDPIIVTLSNIRLEGADSYKYEIINNIDNIVKYAYITPREITVKPKINSIFYGQNIPEIDCEIDKTSIIADDIVSFSINVNSQNGAADIGKYNFIVDSDNKNYRAKIADQLNFEVREYDPETACIPESESNIYFTNKAILNSPEGFFISSDGINFSNSIELNLNPTHGNEPSEAIYYLKNIDASSPAFNAISKEMKYGYYYSCAIPEIIKAEIKPVDSEDNLNLFPFGWVSNGSVSVEITAKGTEIDQPTCICLKNNDCIEEKEAEGTLGEDGIWYYSAEFTINLSDEEADDYCLTAYSINQSGKETEKNLILTDEYNNTTQINQNRIIIDKIKPSFDENLSINYNNRDRYAEAKGEIYDADSGINKIEYQWNDDKESGFTEYKFNDSSDGEYSQDPIRNVTFYVKENYSSFSDDYVDQYKLHLKITDNAGNISTVTIEKSDNGRDTKPPVINYITFRKSGSNQDDSNLSEFINISENGNFAKEEIELVVVAEDMSETEYVSGIKSVKICDNDNIRDFEQYENNGEYIFKLPLNTRIENMIIKLTDKEGTESLINVKDKMELKSNLLVVENEAPNVDFIVKNALNDDVKVSDTNSLKLNSDKNIWYNENDSDVSCNNYNGNFVISVNDSGSGINKVVISDNAEGLINNEFMEIKTEYNYAIKTSELNDGEHRFIVKVIDNAGNEKVYEQVIYVDKEKPSGLISIESPRAKEINEELWIDKNDVVTIRVDADHDLSGIEEVTIYINSKKFSFTGSQIIKSENGYFVKANTKDMI